MKQSIANAYHMDVEQVKQLADEKSVSQDICVRKAVEFLRENAVITEKTEEEAKTEEKAAAKKTEKAKKTASKPAEKKTTKPLNPPKKLLIPKKKTLQNQLQKQNRKKRKRQNNKKAVSQSFCRSATWQMMMWQKRYGSLPHFLIFFAFLIFHLTVSTQMLFQFISWRKERFCTNIKGQRKAKAT